LFYIYFSTIRLLSSSYQLFYMKSLLLNRFLPALALIVAFSGTVLAQTPADGGPAPTSPVPVPLDGGVSLLLAGGVAYGLKQLRNRRKRA
jgi:hypothetical protein